MLHRITPGQTVSPWALVVIVSVSLAAATSVYAQPVSSWVGAYGKSSTKFSSEDWAAVIDETWPPSMTTTQQLELFDRWWRNVDRLFGAFQDLDPGR